MSGVLLWTTIDTTNLWAYLNFYCYQRMEMQSIRRRVCPRMQIEPRKGIFMHFAGTVSINSSRRVRGMSWEQGNLDGAPFSNEVRSCMWLPSQGEASRSQGIR